MIESYKRDIVRMYGSLTDAVYLHRSKTESTGAITLISIHDIKHVKSDYPMPCEFYRQIDLMCKYDRLFDLYVLPSSIAPDICGDDMDCIFDCGIERSDFIFSFPGDPVNKRKYEVLHEAGALIAKGEVDDEELKRIHELHKRRHAECSCRDMHPGIQFWELALTKLPKHLLAELLMSGENNGLLQCFCQDAPFIRYSFAGA